MLASVNTCALVGLDGQLVEVQVDIAHQGLPNFFLVGLAATAVKEARERVRTAIKNSGLAFPLRRITVNLAPAELPKQGPSYDLPLALAILVASGQLDGAAARTRSSWASCRSTASCATRTGILPMVATARASAGLQQVFVPAMDAAEAALVEGVDVLPRRLAGRAGGPPARRPGDPARRGDRPAPRRSAGRATCSTWPRCAARSTPNARSRSPPRAATICSSPARPGAGKTLLARALPSILPPMTSDETLEVTRIYSVAGAAPAGRPAVRERPFRAPHHTVSYAGLVGGGVGPRPGEISLAHRGVLFLDEIPEFGHHVLEVMRQPIEDGVVTHRPRPGLVQLSRPSSC